ncbi:MAG TPA: ATP-binding protein [Paucimonas sp.]|nr:ATP-binding protein [Paucimonas sp.]
MEIRRHVEQAALLFSALLLQSPCLAMPIAEIAPGFPRSPIFEQLEFLEDRSQAVTLEQARTLRKDSFSRMAGSNFVRGFSASAFWLRTTLRNTDSLPVEWVLQHRVATTDFAEFWVFVDGKVAEHAIGGDRTLMSDRQVQFRYPAIKFTSPPNKDAEVYIRLWNINAADVHLRFELETGQDFVRQVNLDQLRLGILYGIPFALSFYALTGWFVSLDRRFALYGLYTLAIVGTWAGVNGQLSEFLPFDSPKLANDLLHIFVFLSIIFSLKFARTFLHVRRLLPRIDASFTVIIWIASCGILLRMLGVFSPVTLLSIALMFSSVLTPIVAWLVYRQGVLYARWYLFAQILYVMTIATGLIGTRLGWFSYSTIIYAQVAFLGELLFLAVAQHDRVRLLQHERHSAERRYQKELQRRIQLLDMQVEERSRSLNQARLRSQFLDEARAVTKLVASGDFSVRMTSSNDVEMNELACSVNTMTKSLAKLDNARRLWIAEVSHELRTPLSILRGEIELLRGGFQKLDRCAIESLYEETVHLSRLINDLHDLAVSCSRNLSCHFTEWDFCSLLRKIGKRYRKQANKKGIALKTFIPDGDMRVRWDKGRIRQLLENLLLNSLHYTDAPGCIEIHVESAGCNARLLVQDSAPGIDSEDMDRLFEPFFRSRTARSSRRDGSGLGLAVCAAIVRAHGGRISTSEASIGGVSITIEMALRPDGADDGRGLHPASDGRKANGKI